MSTSTRSASIPPAMGDNAPPANIVTLGEVREAFANAITKEHENALAQGVLSRVVLMFATTNSGDLEAWKTQWKLWEDTKGNTADGAKTKEGAKEYFAEQFGIAPIPTEPPPSNKRELESVRNAKITRARNHIHSAVAVMLHGWTSDFYWQDGASQIVAGSGLFNAVWKAHNFEDKYKTTKNNNIIIVNRNDQKFGTMITWADLRKVLFADVGGGLTITGAAAAKLQAEQDPKPTLTASDPVSGVAFLAKTMEGNKQSLSTTANKVSVLASVQSIMESAFNPWEFRTQWDLLNTALTAFHATQQSKYEAPKGKPTATQLDAATARDAKMERALDKDSEQRPQDKAAKTATAEEMKARNNGKRSK